MSCPRFVQNAWKRDLCSNCFKGKEDHAPVVDNRARYLASLKDITKRPPPPSILKGVIRKNVSAFKVHFPTEESQVIGYGGDEFSDNEEEGDFGAQENIKSDDDPVHDEDDEHFQKLTESNTEFNKNPANLNNDSSSTKPSEGTKKTTPSLKLGQIQNKADGKKQTLLVSVQPFGSPAGSTPLAVSRKTHLNNLLHETSPAPAELKTTIPVDISTPNDKKTDITSEKDNSSPKYNKDNDSLPEIPPVNNNSVDNKAEPCVDQIPNLETKKQDEVEEDSKKTDKQTENRLNSLSEGKKSLITRGTILTKTHEQAKTKRYFQLGPIKPDEELPVSESLYKKFEINDKSNNTIFSKAKDTISIKSMHQKNSRNLTNALFSSKLLKKEFGIQPDLQLKSFDYIDSNKSAINKEEKDSLVNKNQHVNYLKLLPVENIERTEKSDVVIIDGVPAESREMAGEPDGRADSDEMDEPPPELPTTPPPCLTEHIPRPSFLHNIPKEKPKLPVKPKLSPPKELVLDHAQLDDTPSDPSLSPSARQCLITKRQAPKPPPTPLGESPPKVQFAMCSEEGPAVCRERASSCSPLPSDSSSNSSHSVEPSARRSLSLSNETLVCSTPTPALDKKKGNKMRSTLRKFLRLASREEFKCEELGPPPLPPPRPRPEIIHPLDLNKSAVQVLRSDGSLVSSNKQNSPGDSPTSPTSPVSPGFHGRPSKPPPPPRSQSLDCDLGRPARPPPPTRDMLTTQRLTDTALLCGNHSVYVNLGDVRSSIAPAKPQRTASLREKDKDVGDSAYQQTSALQMSDNLYESLAPECDASRERSSLPYYGSETESDIYCPYTFTNSHKGGEELRTGKARTVVHKSLEDNYGAVVVANHEALTQLLEQVSPGPMVPPALRTLKTCPGLQWTDFTIEGNGEVVGSRVFLPATWGAAPVTLCLTVGQARLPVSFAPLTQFFDVVASQYLSQEKTELVQVSVAVLLRQQFFTLSGYAAQMSSSADIIRESALLLVQIVNSLKTLQAQGHEEASLSQFVLSREESQCSPRVCLLPHDVDKGGESMSLCRCAVKAIDLLSMPQPLAAILRSVLTEERATSLTQAKAAIELWLWGPSHVPVSVDSQGSLQRWLDLERATVLQSLVVRRPLALSSSDYCHLSFLVRTNAKVMADALVLLDRS